MGMLGAIKLVPFELATGLTGKGTTMGILQDNVRQMTTPPADQALSAQIPPSPSPEGVSPAQAGQPSPPPTPQVNVPEGEWEDRVVLAAQKILYEEGSGDQMINQITQGDPIQAIANTTVTLVTSIDDKLGGQIPEDDILPAAVRIMENVAELRSQATGEELTEDIQKQAVFTMIGQLSEEYGVTPEQAQEFAGSFSEEEVAAANQQFGSA